MWPSLYTYWSVGQRQVQNYNALFQALECHLTVSCVFSLSSQEEYVSRGFDVWNLLLVYLDIFINNGKNISGFWETKNYSSGLEISGNLQLHLEETLLSFFSASWIVVFLPWLFLLDLALFSWGKPVLRYTSLLVQPLLLGINFLSIIYTQENAYILKYNFLKIVCVKLNHNSTFGHQFNFFVVVE